MKRKLLLAAVIVAGALGMRAQTNLIAGWDGGNDTSSPSNFGWTSSSNATLQPRDNNGGIRMTTTYSGYKLEDGTSYSYSATSDPSSVVFWVRYNAAGESFTYTFQGLEADTYYDFSALIGWHNNSDAPNFTVKLNDGTTDLATMTKAVSSKQTMYEVTSRFKAPSTMTSTTDVKIVFTCNKTGDCMEAISALKLVEVVSKDVLETAITAATNANTSLNSSDLADAITAAQAVYDKATATQEQVNAAAATLNAAVELAMSAVGDATFLIVNPGFESCTVTTTNAAATANAAPLNISGEWTQASSAAWSSSAVVEYGGAGQVNGASAPSADNLGNTGNTLGVSVGWGGLVTYQSKSATLPAGVYTIKINGYNANTGATQFTSKFGFVPTTGTPALSTKTSFTANTWEIDEVTFTLNEATEGCIQVGGQAGNAGSGSHAKVFFDNITVSYKSFLAGAKAAWEEAVANAETAKTENPNVTGDELDALDAELAKAEPTTVDGYNAATAALSTATETLVAAAPSYNAFVDAKGAATPELKYAAAAKKTALNDAKAAEDATSAADATTKTAAITTALRAYYESHALAEGVAGAVNMTDLIINNNNPTNLNNWTVNNTVGNCNMRTISGQPYTNADGTTANTYFDTNSWGTAFTSTFTQVVKLRAGKYLLSVKARGNGTTTYQVTANNEATDISAIGDAGGVFGRGWNDYSVEFEIAADADVTLGMNMVTGASSNWLSFSNFRLVRLELYTEMAGAAEYEAMDNALAAAKSKTLGFETGEYAPYNNIEAIKAIATAEAVDTDAENAKADIEAITTALGNWTANTEEVNAVYDGTFAAATNNGAPAGWTMSNNTLGGDYHSRAFVGDERLAEFNETNSGLFLRFDGINSDRGSIYYYGNTEGYTMPLKADTYYSLTVDFAGWGSTGKPLRLNVTGPEGFSAKSQEYTTEVQADNANNTPQQFSITFKTGSTEGNYVINFQTPGADSNTHNVVVSNIELFKADEANMKIAAKKYATFCAPFAVTIPDGVTAYTVDGVEEDGTTLKTTALETTIPANTPVLLYNSSEELINKSVYGKAVAIEGDPTEGLLTGVYSEDAAIPIDSYVLQTQNGVQAFYYVDSSSDVKTTANRAYLKLPASGAKARVLFFEKEDATFISVISALISCEVEAIYSVNGTPQNGLQKGINIVKMRNGETKKVLVK